MVNVHDFLTIYQLLKRNKTSQLMKGKVGVLATCKWKPTQNLVSCDPKLYGLDEWVMENVKFCTSATVISETVQAMH